MRRDEVTVIFDGAGTQWVPALSDEDHKYHRLFEAIKDNVAGVCSYCAGRTGPMTRSTNPRSISSMSSTGTRAFASSSRMAIRSSPSEPGAESLNRQARIGDVPIRWRDYGGDGPPVVFIHGIPTSPLLWRHVVAQLESCRPLAWEMVGYSQSWEEGRERNISVRAQASYLHGWLENQGIENAILVGHDLGGGVAQIAAVADRDRFAGLVLTNSICYDSWPIPSVKAMRALGGMVGRTPPKLFRAVFSSFLRRGHDDQRVAAESIRVHWPNYDHESGPAAFVRQIRSLDVTDTMSVAPRLDELHLPARVVWGGADRFQKLSYGVRLARDLNAEIDVIDGGKHFVPEDQPDRIADAIRSLIKETAT